MNKKQMVACAVMLTALWVPAEVPFHRHDVATELSELGRNAVPGVNYEFVLSPWRNWVLCSKRYGSPADSIQLLVFPAYDTLKSIHLTTVRRVADSRPGVHISSFMATSPWSLLQDTIFFGAAESDINTSPDGSWETFFVDVSEYCGVLIPNLEFTEYTGSMPKSRTPAELHKAISLWSHPNPSTRGAMLEFSTTSRAFALVKIYNSQGELINALGHPTTQEGMNRIMWDSRDASGFLVPSGKYYFVIECGDGISKKSHVVVR